MPGLVHQLASQRVRQSENRSDQGVELQSGPRVALQRSFGGEI